jgi:E3 ubiquitin-protein ligase MYCBP2
VGLGICVAFELIRESRNSLPSLCIRVLQALLNALQGQLPEGLKSKSFLMKSHIILNKFHIFSAEPSDVINPLFDLLLELASSSPTYHENGESSASSSTSVSNSSTFLQLKSYACSALLSLVTARGDTGKILTAITALLTSPQLAVDNDEIETPNILISLQRSVHCVLLGTTKRPDWVSHGFSVNSLCDTFNVQIPPEISTHFKQSSLAFDGKYLYLYSGNQIHKIGSGYCGTVKGQLIHSNSIGSHKTQSGLIGWIGYVKDNLYLQTNNWTHNELIKLDKNSLKEVGKVTLGVTNLGPSACASDNDSLILITSTKDDCFVIRTLKPSTTTTSTSHASTSSSYLMPVTQELTIKLSHKCLNVCGGIGSAIFEPSMSANDQQMKQQLLRPIDSVEADDIVQICSGKDFALIRTYSGKVFFTGKAQSLGIKQNGSNAGKWSELPITKSPKIEHISVGHEGAHALLVAEDGSAFFVGLAKRGEDGEQTKGRRQPKAGKPKKMIKMEGKLVEFVACNHGSSAIVTKSGELYLFGKDAHHVDRNTGLVSSLRNVVISQVAIGKAHILALSNKGHVYTFGISNKGQCGLDLMQATATKDLASNQEDIDEGNAEQKIDVTEDVTEPLCSLGHHRWKYDQCMICTICGECTGYGASCIASGKSERNPGMSCGCGAGDAGCADCGCCRACEAIPKETFATNDDNEASMLPLNRMAYNAAQQLNYCDPLNADMHRFATAFAMVDGGIIPAAIAANDLRNKEHDYEELPAVIRGSIRGDVPVSRLNPRIERRRIGIDVLGRRLRHASKAYRNLVGGAANGRAIPVDGIGENGASNVELIDKIVSNVINIDIDQGSDGETSKLTPIPPTKLSIPSRIIQIACGLHHSVLLTSSGDVLTFGSNQFGQLGHNDFAIREVPTKVLINATIVQIAAGSNHTVLLSSTGQVFTFGSNQKGQLGRTPSAIDFAWNAIPAIIPNIGQQYGRKATFISASGDHTFIKFDESLINPLSLSSARVIANRRCIAIIPSNSEMSTSVNDCRYDSSERTFHSLVISRADGSCKSFNTSDQLELSNFSAVCLDNYYDVLWTYDSETHSFNRYNIIAAESKIPNQSISLTSILLPELALPQKYSTHVNRTTAALNLLCTLDTLTSAHQIGIEFLNLINHFFNFELLIGWTIQDEDQSKNQITKSLSKDDFSSVCRFESHGGGNDYCLNSNL